MLSSIIATAGLTLASLGATTSAVPVIPLPTAAPTPAEGHGKLTWFEGSWEELLVEAEKQDKIIFLDFWAEW